MAITIGTNSYLTLADFNEWAALRGKDLTSYTSEQIEAALVVSALDFIDVNYTFKGGQLSTPQAMALPTDKVAINDIYSGASQAAWQALSGELFINPTANSSGQVISQRDKLDVLETETEYQASTASSYTHNTTQISKLLKPYTSASSADMGKLSRCWQ